MSDVYDIFVYIGGIERSKETLAQCTVSPPTELTFRLLDFCYQKIVKKSKITNSSPQPMSSQYVFSQCTTETPLYHFVFTVFFFLIYLLVPFFYTRENRRVPVNFIMKRLSYLIRFYGNVIYFTLEKKCLYYPKKKAWNIFCCPKAQEALNFHLIFTVANSRNTQVIRM